MSNKADTRNAHEVNSPNCEACARAAARSRVIARFNQTAKGVTA